MSKVGYCCITLQPDGKKDPKLQNSAATVKHVSSLSAPARAAYLRAAADRNIEALYQAVRHLASGPLDARMMRITSGLLPLYTHELAQPVYLDPEYHREWRAALYRVGKLARAFHVRLSFHPGQYTVLNSASESIRRAALKEFEYHTRCAHYMGYAGGNAYAQARDGTEIKDGFIINVHGGAWHGDLKTSLASWDWSWARLSPAAKRMITLENDEMSWGFNEIRALCYKLGVRMVPDVHHHWVRTGEWLDPNEPGIQDLLFRGSSKVHVSLPLPEFLSNGRTPLTDQPLDPNVWGPSFDAPLPVRPEGVSLTKLRTHSDYLYYPGFIGYLDRWYRAGWSIQVEAKAKNLASAPLLAAFRYRRGQRVHYDTYRERWLFEAEDSMFMPAPVVKAPEKVRKKGGLTMPRLIPTMTRAQMMED